MLKLIICSLAVVLSHAYQGQGAASLNRKNPSDLLASEEALKAKFANLYG